MQIYHKSVHMGQDSNQTHDTLITKLKKNFTREIQLETDEQQNQTRTTRIPAFWDTPAAHDYPY